MNPNQDPDQLEILLDTTELLQRELGSLRDSKLGAQLKTFHNNVQILEELNRKLVWRQTTHQMALMCVVMALGMCGMWWLNMEWRDQTHQQLVSQTRAEFLKAHPILRVEGTLSRLTYANDQEWSELKAIGECMVQRDKQQDPKAKTTSCLPEPKAPDRSKKRRRKRKN